MKKLIILSVFLLVLSVSLFAASQRVFNQQLVLANEPDNPDDALNYITNEGLVPNTNYILRVTANGETKGTDLGQAGQNMRIYRNTLSGQIRALAMFNQSLWTANWVVGSNLVIDIWWVGTPEGQGDGFGAYPQYKHAQKTWVVVSGSVVSQINENAMVIPPPFVVSTVDYEEGVPTVVAPGITIVLAGGDGNVVDAPLPFPEIPGGAGANVPIYTETIELLGAGPWTISYDTTAPVGAWYSYVTHTWNYAYNVAGTITFVIPVGGKDIPEIPIILGDETLPVEFSSFAAVLTAQNFVKLTWVTETETGVSGYNVYRSTDANQATAVQINPALIDATNTSQTATYTHVDNEVSAQTTYSYWLEIVEMDGTTAFHGPTTVYVENAPVNDAPVLVTTMGNAYPNPFKANSSTSIPVEVKDGETGTITIYNIIGQVVKTESVKGTKVFNWNGRDSKNNACGSGIYFYKLSTPSRNVTKKMVIVN